MSAYFRAGSRIVLGATVALALLLGQWLFVAAAPAQAAALGASPRTWQVGVGLQSKDFAIQGMVFLPDHIWIDQGDTITWTSNSSDIHTVTFLQPGQSRPTLNFQDPNQVNQVGGTTYDGKSYYNSGLLINIPGAGYLSYSLTFGVVGNFPYISLPHARMHAMVSVRPAGTSYPYTQQQYDHAASVCTKSLLERGADLRSLGERLGTKHHVVDGIGDGTVSVIRIFPASFTIHQGDTVTFTNLDSLDGPHTVTFGPQPANDFSPYGNPASFDGTTPLNSGWLGASPSWFGFSYRVTYAATGTFTFYCDLHDYLGMDATIRVAPGR